MEKPKLHAIACERIVKDRDGRPTVIPEIVHVHALDRANARFIFLQDADHRKNYRIVEIAQVIGYHVDDEHGEKLRA